MPISPNSSRNTININSLIDWYNDTIRIINDNNDNNDNHPLADYMKDFYEESWTYDNSDPFKMNYLDNISWYIKSEEEKRRILDEEIDAYFDVNL